MILQANLLEPLSGNSPRVENPVIDSKTWFPSGFPQENVCYHWFKHVGITTFMTAFFLGTIEWELVNKYLKKIT